jgi:flavorubredoxin
MGRHVSETLYVKPSAGHLLCPMSETRIDHIVGGIYRISTWQDPYGITFNQFLIDDERPALIHTGMRGLHGSIRAAIAQVLDPARLAHILLLHWEGDENGGMTDFMAEAAQSELDGSLLSIQLNAFGFGFTERVRGFRDSETLDLGKHKLRFLETPHVHHWDSMMLLEETTRSLFPSDLFIQPADQPPMVTENLSAPMLELYRGAGIFAHEFPVRQVVERVQQMQPAWIHPMHGGSFAGAALAHYADALRNNDFAYRGTLLGREIAKLAPM